MKLNSKLYSLFVSYMK